MLNLIDATWPIIACEFDKRHLQKVCKYLGENPIDGNKILAIVIGVSRMALYFANEKALHDIVSKLNIIVNEKPD